MQIKRHIKNLILRAIAPPDRTGCDNNRTIAVEFLPSIALIAILPLLQGCATLAYATSADLPYADHQPS